MQVNDEKARVWYEKEAAEQTWSVRTLQRNISSQYYYRILQTQKKEIVEREMKELTAEYQNDKLEFIKNPVIAEFLGLASNTDFTESDLERSILSNLQKFLMELGKGYVEHKRDTYYDDPKDNTAFERCIDVMSRLMLKHGSDVLDKIERKKWEKVQEAHCKEMGNMV